jgi:hypothetical protein
MSYMKMRVAHKTFEQLGLRTEEELREYVEALVLAWRSQPWGTEKRREYRELARLYLVWAKRRLRGTY